VVQTTNLCGQRLKGKHGANHQNGRSLLGEILQICIHQEGAVQFETKLKAKFEGNQPSWDALAEALTATAQECCAVL